MIEESNEENDFVVIGSGVCTLFVGNLGRFCTADQLRDYFSEFEVSYA